MMDDTVKAGGVDMPPKTDMYDWTTPSGATPIIVSPSQWRRFRDEGVDMRWYVANRPIPATKAR